MKRAALYIRVSTAEQAAEGISLEGQERDLRVYTAAAGLDVLEVVTDAGVSGFKPLADRPGGARLLDLVKTGKADAVVAWKLDRLFRNSANALTVVEAWQRKGIAVHIRDLGGSAVDTSSATGKLFLAMLSAFAQFERDQTSERIRCAMSLKKSRHEFTGGRVPFGYRLAGDGKTLEPDELEREAIAFARDLQTVEGLSLRKICRELERRGYKPRAATTWRSSSLHEILKAGAA